MEISFYQSSNSVIKWPHACSQVPLCQEYLTNNYWIFIIVDNMLDEAEDRGKKGEGSTNWEKSSDRNRWGNRWQAFSANESFLSDPSPIVALATLVTNSLTDSLLNSLLFSRLDWCVPGVWRCQLKTCWCCSWWRCWCWGSCWKQFVADLGTDVWLNLFRPWVWLRFWVEVRQDLKLEFGQYFAADIL